MIFPTQQRVLMLRKFGGPDGFAVVERPVPEPGAGEVLVKVLAASIQFTDIMLRKGQYPDLKEKPPLVLGYDLVGEVVKLGRGVTSPSVGQRVADLTMIGSYAQYRTLKADQVAIVDAALDPAGSDYTGVELDDRLSAAASRRASSEGQKLFVIGAAGAVGQALVLLGKLAGCELWGTARARHADFVRALGAIHVDRPADFGAGGAARRIRRGVRRHWRAGVLAHLACRRPERSSNGVRGFRRNSA